MVLSQLWPGDAACCEGGADEQRDLRVKYCYDPEGRYEYRPAHCPLPACTTSHCIVLVIACRFIQSGKPPCAQTEFDVNRLGAILRALRPIHSRASRDYDLDDYYDDYDDDYDDDKDNLDNKDNHYEVIDNDGVGAGVGADAGSEEHEDEDDADDADERGTPAHNTHKI